MIDKGRVCECCGAKIVEYEHGFNQGLKSCMRKLAEHGTNPVKIKGIGLTTSEWTNFAKLRYWGLAERAQGNKAWTHAGGVWQMTNKGHEFMIGYQDIYEKVVVCRNVVMGFKGKMISFGDKENTEYQHRGDYRDQVRQQIQAGEPVQIKLGV